ncbi:MAG: hypothetical protein IPK74_05785 [Deltaproteobacteria bacterium]|nr:hypothetical protein [Deltaproteobacteria bacterium]
MTTTALLFALAGIVTTGAAGYLLGIVLGRGARHRLAAHAQGQAQQIAQLQLALSEQQATMAATAGVREQVQGVLAGMMGQQQATSDERQAQIQAQMQSQFQSQMQALQRQIVQLMQLGAGERTADEVERVRQEIHRALAPMLERDREQKGLRELVLDVLGPMMESERRAQGLKNLIAPARGREQLPILLDSIARRGGFAAVLLSDEVGLPLAASSSARNADVLAGVSSLILSLADRVTKTGGPTPTAVLVRDTANQLILHRIFTAAGERFLLTGVSKGTEVSTNALDPALAALEDVLSKSQAA